MAHIPDHPIPVEIQGLIQGQGEFHHPETRPQMSATVGDDLEVALPDLTGHILQLSHGQTMQLIGMR